jgi:hypothetical protein
MQRFMATKSKDNPTNFDDQVRAEGHVVHQRGHNDQRLKSLWRDLIDNYQSRHLGRISAGRFFLQERWHSVKRAHRIITRAKGIEEQQATTFKRWQSKTINRIQQIESNTYKTKREAEYALGKQK